MAGDAVLVLGATGLSGLCLLRELLHRNHPTIAYVRNPSKIPDDLKSNPLLEVISGPIDDTPTLTTALARSATVISLLGPSPSDMTPFGPPLPYPAYYAEHILPVMKQTGVRRIFALSTISAVDEARDRFVLLRWVFKTVVRLLAPSAYWAMVGIAGGVAGLGEEPGQGEVDWMVFRVPGLFGGERDGGKGVYVGPVGPGWTGWLRRGRLARWLVDCVEGEREGVGRMPAVSDARE